jgi:hypothetical protein
MYRRHRRNPKDKLLTRQQQSSSIVDHRYIIDIEKWEKQRTKTRMPKENHRREK